MRASASDSNGADPTPAAIRQSDVLHNFGLSVVTNLRSMLTTRLNLYLRSVGTSVCILWRIIVFELMNCRMLIVSTR
jgi:hypothetical protein